MTGRSGEDYSRIEALLRRKRTDLHIDGTPLLTDRVALVTGAAGSIGSEICAQLLHSGVKSLVLLDVDENGLSMLARRLGHQYPGSSSIVKLGNVRDLERIRSIFSRYRPNDVFHAAAHKHVTLAETSPCEAVKNNIAGTAQLTEVSDEFDVERFVYISTDKAVRPASVMGATKRVGEELVRARGRSSRMRCCVVRFGNVFDSAGSVVPIFREQIASGGPVTVTSRDASRYFMNAEEAVALLLHAAYEDYGELCALDMGEPIRVLDLAHTMIGAAGLTPDVDIAVEFTGLQPGEKLHEELLNDDESSRRVHPRILAVDGPAPHPELERQVRELIEAAGREQDDEVLRLLQAVTPDPA